MTLSLIAYEVDTHETIDLRDRSSGSYVDWNPPHGNWNIMQFVCIDDPDSETVNYLSYDASYKYIMLAYKKLTDRYRDLIGDTVTMTFYRNIHYATENRRMWDEAFNRVFIELFDFDPAPYYPALYMDIGHKTEEMRAMFMACRTFMLEHGFFKAVADFTKAHGLASVGYVAEGKTVHAPWLFGDGMNYQRLSGAVCTELANEYAYGMNALKLASSAAYNYDKEQVICDIFGGYEKLDCDTVMRESLNAYARGINSLFLRIGRLSGNGFIDGSVCDFNETLPKYNEFAARTQMMLRGGRHICDIALLYPIFSLEQQTMLYEMGDTAEFEYPNTPENADFMNVINLLMNYCGHDVTVLHPITLNKRCYIEDGKLYLCNDGNHEKYRLLILPAASMMSVKNLRTIKRLYDSGGKIIATGELPHVAFEYGEDAVSESLGESRSGELPEQLAESGEHERPLTPDEELNELIGAIFSVTSEEVNSFKPYYKNTNENGGIAYYLPASRTAADGTEMPDPQLFARVLDELGIDYDVYADNMPKTVQSGILNVSLPLFKAMNKGKGLRYGGVFNYIHRRMAGCNIYFFSNTASTDFNGTLHLRGKYIPEKWDPHTGSMESIDYKHTLRGGEAYTEIKTEIKSASSLFFVCRGDRPQRKSN